MKKILLVLFTVISTVTFSQEAKTDRLVNEFNGLYPACPSINKDTIYINFESSMFEMYYDMWKNNEENVKVIIVDNDTIARLRKNIIFIEN